MNRPFVATLAALLVAVVGLAAAAEHRFSLTSPNGISFSEFKGYEAWEMIGSSQPDTAGGCGTSPEPGCIKSILGNPAMIKALQAGIPDNGKPVPDGAIMTKIEWAKERITVPYAATIPGKLMEVAFMMKDSKRFPGTNGWGYATFKPDEASGTWKSFGADASFANTCHGCHTVTKHRDYVFTHYSPR